MKIITWNCNMAFRKKAQFILSHKPDILIVPECEHPDKLLFQNGVSNPTDTLWFGQNKNKGLGIFSYCDFKFKVLDIYNDSLQIIIPVSVFVGQFSFTLFAVWANNPADRDGQYVTQVWKALHHYDPMIAEKQTLLIGDFNSNTIWDKPKRNGNHTHVVEKLATKKIYSVYHTYFKQVHGKETHPTLYLYRHKDKPYHLDYCFASADMLKHLKSVEVGDYDYWTQYSDHVPIIITFNTTLFKKGANTSKTI